LEDLATHFASNSFALADRFLEAAEFTANFLLKHPEAGQRCNFLHPDAAEIRVWRISGFENYLVLYRTSSRGIKIIRVLHGARDIASIIVDRPKP
jgi:toxin ParE1/3/4